jgi:hypothetical protein
MDSAPITQLGRCPRGVLLLLLLFKCMNRAEVSKFRLISWRFYLTWLNFLRIPVAEGEDTRWLIITEDIPLTDALFNFYFASEKENEEAMFGQVRYLRVPKKMNTYLRGLAQTTTLATFLLGLDLSFNEVDII